MQNLSAGLNESLSGELSHLAELVLITREDGQKLGFTTHDAPIEYQGINFHPDGALSLGLLKRTGELQEKGIDWEGLLGSPLINEDELRRGLYDFARVDVWLIDWQAPEKGGAFLARGWLGEVTLQNGRFVSRFRGLKDLLSRSVGETYTPECRFQLGDDRCGVSLDTMTVSGQVTALVDGTRFIDVTRGESTGYFDHGILEWTSGKNQGERNVVYHWDLDQLTFHLWLPPISEMSLGDAFKVTPGCDKRFATCRAKFTNAASYGGFPYLPGIGKILDYPEVRS